MAVKLYNDTDIQNIADSIRAKNGSGYTYKVSEMSAAINGLEVLNGETVSITPSTSAQTITPSSGHNGITEVNVAAVTSSIDSNIQAGNIKKDVSILGVTGTLSEKQLGTKTITENGTYKATDDNLDGYSEVEVATSGVDMNDYYIMEGGNFSSAASFIKKLPLFDFSQVTNVYHFFFGLKSLITVPLFNITHLTSLVGMFDSCEKLEEVPLLDTSNATSMASMFSYCYSLKAVPNFNTNNVTDLYQFCYQCNSLLTIPKLNASKVTRVENMLYGCRLLTNLGGFENLGMAYDTSQSANYSKYTLNLRVSNDLTHESLMNVINNLYDIKTKGCNAQQLILGATNINKLTSEEIAIATNKGFSVS